MTMEKSCRFEVKSSDFKKLTVWELVSLFDAIREVREVAVAVSNWPKLNCDSKIPGFRDFNEAGEMFEKLIDFLDGYEQLLVKRLRKTTCDDTADVDRKYERLLQYYGGEGLTFLNALVSKGLSEQRRVRKPAVAS